MLDFGFQSSCWIWKGKRRAFLRMDATDALHRKLQNAGRWKVNNKTLLGEVANTIKQWQNERSYSTPQASGKNSAQMLKKEGKTTGDVNCSGSYGTNNDRLLSSIGKENVDSAEGQVSKYNDTPPSHERNSDQMIYKELGINEVSFCGPYKCGDAGLCSHLKKESVSNTAKHLVSESYCTPPEENLGEMNEKKKRIWEGDTYNESTDSNDDGLLGSIEKEGINSATEELPEMDTLVIGESQNQISKSPRDRRRRLHHSLRHKIRSLLRNNFNRSKVKMLRCFATLIRPTRYLKEGTFEGFLSLEEVKTILSCVPSTKKTRHKFNNLYDELTLRSAIKVDDLIYMQENFSGVRLTNELRKRLPNVIPSQANEATRKKQYYREFQSVLLPRRTASGWRIDPFRLTEVLCFRYFGLMSPLQLKVYGDGREIGGRPATYIALSLLNNELALYGYSYQSPSEIFPVAMFYEKDSRDNLEENLDYGRTDWLNEYLKDMQNKGDAVYLTGDEMFLEHILDGSGELSPSSEYGWNIYSRVSKEQKSAVSVSGLRTDIGPAVDRSYPESILNSIPLENVVLCLLHALARSVEKLLSLVISDICSLANIKKATDKTGDCYREEKIGNLENNISKRGVRQGSFSFHFDCGGKLKPIKLNKDHALAVIAPPPIGMSSKFPHVLHNVLSDTVIPNTLPSIVTKSLQLPAQFTELGLVSSIWDHFHVMINILKKDRKPVLKHGRTDGSLDPEDYDWSYTDEDKSTFKLSAEKFYQLFKLKYSVSELTPYMIKLIDMGRYFMVNLPFSLGRFQAEGGEHLNYIHNTFYYQHTTRHGGKHHRDPVLATLSHMWKNLSYCISNSSDCMDSKEAAKKFKLYKERHMAATKLQALVRGSLV
ncbi:hypothetical protein HOLleu_03423 [Holothuria leucospilota]|uniref:Uncharacterized protein n=1 Tax=Holothuria leucospilota TaxID=206669 RepID=A0A9Q1CRX7_HOLLE|nr:hypothetical protein HOLleu_03423 [Holothuria leucospilota]